MNSRFKPYPLVDIHFINVEGDPNLKASYSLKTSYRIQHADGRWFWGDCVKTYKDSYLEVNPFTLAEIMRSFHAEVYFMTQCGIVTESIRSLEGEPLFYLCDDQTPEKERLKNIIIP